MSSEVAIPEGSAYAMLKAAGDFKSRTEAARFAITAVEVPGFTHPVPPMFFDLPWSSEGEGVIDDILAAVAAAEDITAVGEARELTDPYDILGQPVTVLGVVARRSDVADAKWGAYLSITASVDGGEPEVINTGAGEVCVVMWRLFCDGLLPITGVFDVKGQAVKGRRQPLTFRVETSF